MKYSVVIPMYNSEMTITDAINSIENQTRYDLIDEIIVVNDGSTDDSLAIVNRIKKVNSKIKIISINNSGAAIARNYGIRNSRNSFIALLDADDEWDRRKIEIQNSILEKYKDIKALGSNRYGEVIEYGEKVNDNLMKISPIKYCFKTWPCTPSIVFDKRIFKDNIFFPEGMSHAEEGMFFLTIASEAGLYYTVDPLVFCGNGKRTFGASGLSGNIKEMHKGVMEMYNRAYKKGYINGAQKIVLKLYEDMKYFRRIIITKFSS